MLIKITSFPEMFLSVFICVGFYMRELGFPRWILTEIRIDWFSVVLVSLAEKPHPGGKQPRI